MRISKLVRLRSISTTISVSMSANTLFQCLPDPLFNKCQRNLPTIWGCIALIHKLSFFESMMMTDFLQSIAHLLLCSVRHTVMLAFHPVCRLCDVNKRGLLVDLQVKYRVTYHGRQEFRRTRQLTLQAFWSSQTGEMIIHLIRSLNRIMFLTSLPILLTQPRALLRLGSIGDMVLSLTLSIMDLRFCNPATRIFTACNKPLLTIALCLQVQDIQGANLPDHTMCRNASSCLLLSKSHNRYRRGTGPIPTHSDRRTSMMDLLGIDRLHQQRFSLHLLSAGYRNKPKKFLSSYRIVINCASEAVCKDPRCLLPLLRSPPLLHFPSSRSSTIVTSPKILHNPILADPRRRRSLERC